MPDRCDIGLIGLAPMGRNLALNLADHGFRTAVYNRTAARVDELLAGPARGKSIRGFRALKAFTGDLEPPRRILMMVRAGSPVDDLIAEVSPLLDPGDILIDGGNSLFADTERRIRDLESRGLWFVGAGISGGEEGARFGPSIMPGGSAAAWPHLERIFQAIAAKVGPRGDIPCCRWIGPGGSGHYVKMVHNGIEYGDMQLICEAYALLKEGLGLTNAELYDVFTGWNRGELDSYLIEITRDIFSVSDPETGKDLVDLVVDRAGQKGTGSWTGREALELGVPATLATEAVFARCLSAQKDRRIRAARLLRGPREEIGKFRAEASRAEFVERVRRALYAAKICSYAQGFELIAGGAAAHGWDLLPPGDIAMLWRGGCVIRAAFLERIREAYDRDPGLDHLLLDPWFRETLDSSQEAWREVVATAVRLGIPAVAFGAALSYYDGIRSERLPHNLLQAQRDYFGAHTYERVDRPGTFHTDWRRLRREPQG